MLYKLFAGTYFHILNIENGGKMEFSAIFAVSTIITIVIMSSLALVGMIFAFDEARLFENETIIFSIILTMLFVGCMLVIPGKKYKSLLRAHLDNREAIVRYALKLHIVMGVIFAAGTSILIIRM